jgi:curved DNA-binding protein CbpA
MSSAASDRHDDPDDYYALLGIQPHADEVALRRAWRAQALRWHPDRAGAAATARFQKILAAYLVLSDPVERAAYDRKRGVPVGLPTSGRQRAPATLLQRVSGPLNALLACGVARPAEDGVLELLLTRDEASQGGIVTISMHVPVREGVGTRDALFSAWLTVRPGVEDGTLLHPSVPLRGMVHPVVFRVRVRGDR